MSGISNSEDLLLLDELTFDLAQEFLGDSQVGRDEVLGDALLDQRILFSEIQVTVPGRHAQVSHHSFLRGYKGSFNYFSKKSLKYRNLFEKFVMGFIGKQDNLCVFKALHIEVRRSLCNETSQVRGPPVFNREHDHVLLTLVVQVKGLGTSLKDKGTYGAYIPLLQNVLAFEVPACLYSRQKDLLLLLTQLNDSIDIVNKGLFLSTHYSFRFCSR